MALLFLFVITELFLLIKYVLIPLGYVLGWIKGISNKEAARLISNFFPEVGDRLENLLDLTGNADQTELLAASIEQRSNTLKPIPFYKAVHFKDGWKTTRFLIIPLLILGIYSLYGKLDSLFGSHSRVVNYDVAFEQPAPFQFLLLNDSLTVLEDRVLDLKLALNGESVPENVNVILDGKELVMQRSDGLFGFAMQPSTEGSTFYFEANGWKSREYDARTIRTPIIENFRLEFNYPDYLGILDGEVVGTGNAVVPEGTRVHWRISGKNVERIKISAFDTIVDFKVKEGYFTHSIKALKDFNYQIASSNEELKDFERLSYSVEVIPDGFPTIDVNMEVDSLVTNEFYFSGLGNDDYGLREVAVVCNLVGSEEDTQRIVLDQPKKNFHQFYYTFPSGLNVTEGEKYEIHFEVIDNDGIRGGKLSKSKVFTTVLYDDKELKDKEIEQNERLIDELDKGIERYTKQNEELDKITKQESQTKNTSFEQKNKLKEVIQNQKKQEKLFEKFSESLKERLKNGEDRDKFNIMLQERLERQELTARKNRELLDELDKLADKIDKEDLKAKLEELSKKQSSNERSLEQILELTKRYYVTEKMKQIAGELEELSQKQRKLAENELDKNSDGKAQKELNEEFSKLSKTIDELKRDSQALQKPMQIGITEKEQEAVKEDQKGALEDINQYKDAGNSSSEEDKEMEKGARRKQKSAADKMEKMGDKLQQNSSSGGGSSITEDAEMLRQILDNLITFSFKQEALFDQVQNIDADVGMVSTRVRDQKELRRLFEHVDDSLFSLSLRRAELSEFVNEQITEVYYNIDKSLESIAENQLFQGASYQQYVVNSTNTLADFLADILDNMQQNMKPGQGGGQGQDFQLPDIIEGQQSLQQKMNGSNQGQQKGDGKEGEQEGNEGEGEQGSEGKSPGKGDPNGGGEQEQNGPNGNDGQGGNSGAQGQEMGLEEIYEIYKEQQNLRNLLEQQLEDFIQKSDRDLAKKLIRQMEDFENDLLENGITQRTQSKVNNIQHELLKLKNASLKQGKKEERESNTNSSNFTNPITTRPSLFDREGREVEILNRQVLPLRKNYLDKVKDYFNND
ncbi:hypothetical protein M3P19_09555 [Muricauda sp. 2012CJ35-5]|uniref:DUF4175 domain-containing protein n=1 Tax=Flagellimonas spongiicola TaxID=2942208 RepID=A0ABT0PSB5_9FLAO|nr:hypothetical protein [Allomuricauda spongiicola]MCL6274255.1 hypothetical protein [Allomuricauda spongiicola]